LEVIIIIHKKLIITIISILLISSSFETFKAKNSVENNIFFYGLIVPLPSGQDTTIETFENSRVRNLINDLLRLNITVFWSNEDFTALSKRLDSNQTEVFEYKKGAFIIPFSGENFKDALIISIISDYNQTHELDNQSLINNEIYLLEEEININCSKLTETKIAQHFEKPVRYGWPSYLKMAEAGGFFNYEYLLDGETEKLLNNKDFNVLIWPYLPSLSRFFQQFKTFLNIKTTNTIRRFVRNGGGFIGTCYGAFVASLGFITPRIFPSLIYAYNPKFIRFFPVFSLSISDSIMKINLEAYVDFFIATHKVVNINHPVFYGVNNTFKDFFKGPIFSWLGKNTHPLAIFYEIKPFNENNSISNKLKKILIGRTSWANSTFGKGKIILYGSHPDFINNIDPLFKQNTWDGDRFYGRRIIHNSIFFVTSDDKIKINYTGWDSSFIDSVIERTNNLSINDSASDEFEDIYNKLSELFNSIYSFKNTSIDLKELFSSFKNGKKIYAENIKLLNYTIWCNDIYLDYINKTRSSIDVLKRVLPMLYDYNDSILDIVKTIKNEINSRLNESEKIVRQSAETANNIKENLNDSKISFFKKIKILEQGRFILQTFEKCLKYIPKIYFETLKLLRNSWYNYETFIAIQPLN
jgi:hypothetical protein